MSTVILSGTTLLEYVQQARNVCGPDFPIIGLNRQYHIEPSKTFNSLPHTEVDSCRFMRLLNHVYFNSLPHTEVDAWSPSIARRATYFNSLPHTEVDEAVALFEAAVKYFNSLPHTEVDTECMEISGYTNTFQLTTSHRGRRPDQEHQHRQTYFNSLPHTEVDGGSGSGTNPDNPISTHYLTQR